MLRESFLRSSPEIVFFPDGSGTPIPVFKLVKDLGVQTGNMLCPSAQCTEAANKALLPRSLEIGFHPFIRGLSASAPRMWHASLFAKPRCKYQPSTANSKISFKVDNWHVSPPLRRETGAATTSGWPDCRLQDIHGPFGY